MNKCTPSNNNTNLFICLNPIIFWLISSVKFTLMRYVTIETRLFLNLARTKWNAHSFHACLFDCTSWGFSKSLYTKVWSSISLFSVIIESSKLSITFCTNLWTKEECIDNSGTINKRVYFSVFQYLHIIFTFWIILITNWIYTVEPRFHNTYCKNISYAKPDW